MTELGIAASPAESLGVLFASKARAAVLHLFMREPSRAYYQRQIEQETGLTLRSTQRELERLTRLELLYRYAEGNRHYYQVDFLCPIFPELRALVMTAFTPLERVRSELGATPAVRQAFLHEPSGRVLVVTHGGEEPRLALPGEFSAVCMGAEAFAAAVARRADSIAPFLEEGVDLMGRREDVLWRRISRAGYEVPKAEGVS
jgi:hypothetical protein